MTRTCNILFYPFHCSICLSSSSSIRFFSSSFCLSLSCLTVLFLSYCLPLFVSCYLFLVFSVPLFMFLVFLFQFLSPSFSFLLPCPGLNNWFLFLVPPPCRIPFDSILFLSASISCSLPNMSCSFSLFLVLSFSLPTL